VVVCSSHKEKCEGLRSSARKPFTTRSFAEEIVVVYRFLSFLP